MTRPYHIKTWADLSTSFMIQCEHCILCRVCDIMKLVWHAPNLLSQSTLQLRTSVFLLYSVLMMKNHALLLLMPGVTTVMDGQLHLRPDLIDLLFLGSFPDPFQSVERNNIKNKRKSMQKGAWKYIIFRRKKNTFCFSEFSDVF